MVDFSAYNFGDAGQRQSANDLLKSYVGSLNPGGFNTDAVLRGFAGIAEMGRSDDNTFKNTLWNAVNPGSVMDSNFLSDPSQLAAYRSGFDAFNKYKAGDTASLQEALKQVESQKQTLPVAQGGYMQPSPVANGMGGLIGAPGGVAQPGQPIGAAVPQTAQATMAYPQGGYTPTMNGSKAVAPSNFQQGDYQAVARMGGYTGDMGGGQHQAWIDADPTGQRQQQWNQALQSYMSLNGTPSGTVAGGGVEPLGQIEPFNALQKYGISALATPQTAGNGMFQQGSDAFKNAIANILSGTGAVTPEAIQAAMNPFQSQVIDQFKTQLTDEAERAKAKLKSNLAGRSSFGDSSSAIQLSELARNTQSTMADGISKLLYAGYNDATTQANADQERRLQGGKSLADIATTGFNLGTTEYNRGINDIKNLLSAGGMIQDQNQRLLDVLRPDLTGATNYPINNLSQLGDWLNMFPGGQSSAGEQAGSTNTLGQIGSLAAIAGQALPNNYNLIAGINGLPWSDMRVKRDIRKVGEAEGINLYEFAYKGGKYRYRGVMAQEVKHIPGAVMKRDGVLTVDYSRLPVEFERVQ